MTRVLTLADMGLSEQVSFSNRNFEQHFYFPVPQGVVLKDAHVEIHGAYLHPFTGTAAVTLLVNGTPVFTHRLPGGDDGFSLKLVDLNGATFSRRHLDEQGGAIDISLPLHKLRAQGGFLDLGVVLSSQVDATRCIDERGRGNELSIDPKATRLVYSFEGSSVQDIHSLLTTLPRRPVILLPHRELNAVQYGAALRLSQALSGMGLQPEFAAVPQVGDVVDTVLLEDAAKIASVRIPGAMASAIAQRQPYKIVQPAEAAIWLALRMMSPDGLAQAVIDPAQTRQALLTALQGMDADSALGKQLWRELRLDEADRWLPKAALGNANVRVAMLAGQPVLALEGGDIGRGADLLASTWRQIAGSRELVLGTALQMPNRDSSLPHIHFAPNLPVQNVSEQAEWVVPIQLSSLPQGKWPDSFELNLMAAPSGDGLAPVVSVFMNDNLLTATSLRTDGEITRLRAHIPMYALRANNLLRVEIRRRISGGHCSGMAQSFPVQLLPSSYLNLRDAQAVTQFFMLGTGFGRGSEIIVPARYLQDAANTLPVVSSVLRGLSFGETDFKLAINAKPGFKPLHAFVAFESAPDSDTQRVAAGSGRLVVRNKRDHAVFDSAGLGSMAVLQLIQSGHQHGISVITVDGTLPALRKPLELSAGNLAIADAEGVRLAINLDDPENDWQLDEQNRGVLTFMQRYRTWLIVLGLMLLPVVVVLGLRWYFRNRQLKG
ncbi:MAG: cellulose biosynthesis cyclic di-GMP-binding regulatory protein BcsB [Gallionella sp.]|nr:cellulose biosynthesis cyclic di-GMP-binding regulatory protein BcsB [Gallionella sp.]